MKDLKINKIGEDMYTIAYMKDGSMYVNLMENLLYLLKRVKIIIY